MVRSTAKCSDARWNDAKTPWAWCSFAPGVPGRPHPVDGPSEAGGARGQEAKPRSPLFRVEPFDEAPSVANSSPQVEGGRRPLDTEPMKGAFDLHFRPEGNVVELKGRRVANLFFRRADDLINDHVMPGLNIERTCPGELSTLLIPELTARTRHVPSKPKPRSTRAAPRSGMASIGSDLAHIRLALRFPAIGDSPSSLCTPAPASSLLRVWHRQERRQATTVAHEESTLHLLASSALAGCLLAQQVFATKSRKPSFQAVFFCTVIVNSVRRMALSAHRS